MTKRKALAVTMMIAFGSPGMAHAQAAVIDVANLQQQLLQYAEMVEQLKTMNDQLNTVRSQLEQAQQQYASITGARNLGNIVDMGERNYIPRNWRETLALMEGGGETGQLAKSIRDEASLLGEPYFADVSQDTKDALSRQMGAAAGAQALNARVYDQTSDRFERLAALQSQINQAQDLKASADLQARVQVEQAMLTNELIKLQAMNAMLAESQRVQDQRTQEENFRMSSVDY